MSTATLADLMAVQRESLAARPARPSRLTLLLVKLRRVNLRPPLRVALAMLASVTLFVNRHGIVLSACTAVVIGSCTISLTLGLFTAGAALFFLEARRR